MGKRVSSTKPELHLIRVGPTREDERRAVADLYEKLTGKEATAREIAEIAAELAAPDRK